MIYRLVKWSLDNPLIVILATCALIGGGLYAFMNVNVEAYPDPAPAIIEIIAKYPGASAEEVERQVTIPLEVELQNMPGLKYVRSKSLFGLAQMIEGEKRFDIALRFPERLRNSEQAIMNIPVEVCNNRATIHEDSRTKDALTSIGTSEQQLAVGGTTFGAEFSKSNTLLHLRRRPERDVRQPRHAYLTGASRSQRLATLHHRVPLRTRPRRSQHERAVLRLRRT
jgi:multidrug efflux pump subunit AcrB